MSTLGYIVEVYGGFSRYLINMLQIQQNTAARLVTKLSWYTSTETLMQQCGWLSVNQLIHYHSLLLLHKAMIENKPEFINKKIRYPSRETRHNLLQDKRRFKTATALKSFLPRTSFSEKVTECERRLVILLFMSNCTTLKMLTFWLRYYRGFLSVFFLNF